jgi:hypothetical protein
MSLKIKLFYNVFIFLAVIILADGCASHHPKNKKLKPGKPIPCPLKDC